MERYQRLLLDVAEVTERIRCLCESRKAFEIVGRRCHESQYFEEEHLRCVLSELNIEIALQKASKESSKKATDARHLALREFKKKAALAAKNQWENGSKLLHHEMAKYLETTYQDENGINPFWHLPGNDIDASSKKVLLQVVKEVAKEMNRPDMISGQRKSS